MAWRDNFRPASFRDVPFKVEAADSEVGRRSVTFEFPGRDEPYTTDLGRGARRYQLEAYVIGPNYMADRDALRVAFETPGPGRLVHPYWGPLEVAIEGRVRMRESSAEGGMCRFSVSLVEAGAEVRSPAVVPDHAAAVTVAAAVVQRESEADFASSWSIVAAPASTIAAATALVGTAASTVRSVVGRVQAVMSTVAAIGEAVSSFEQSISELIALPRELASSLADIYASVCTDIANIDDAIDAALGASTASARGDLIASLAAAGGPLSYETRISLLQSALGDLTSWTTTLPAPPTTTPERRRQAGNRAAFVRLVNTGAVLGTARAAALPGLEYRDSSQAITLRAALVAAIEGLTADEGMTDALFAALLDLQAAVYRYLTLVAAARPSLVEYTPAVTEPALVTAYRLYADPMRDLEIVARNPTIRHPGFVAGGTAIQVVSDA